MSTHSLDFGGLLPPHPDSLAEDPDYPLVLRELAELVQGELIKVDVPAERAAAIAETAAEHVRERFGGQPVYWPKGHTMRAKRRRAAMWADFTGNNHIELAQKYGMCVQQVYKALAAARIEFLGKAQGDLFNAQG
ncbi:Mor transcription activator family protein [Roseateles sp. DXS20W]|uniref:Mor transcription activator family protein n=1 Tax=Pelomonas lactea TaxID=3299030 RepID=A0ABW7GK06_9BURK